METDRIRPRNACINRMGGFGTIHGSGFSDGDSENLGQKSDDDRKCLRRYRRMTKAGEVLLVKKYIREGDLVYGWHPSCLTRECIFYCPKTIR